MSENYNQIYENLNIYHLKYYIKLKSDTLNQILEIVNKYQFKCYFKIKE